MSEKLTVKVGCAKHIGKRRKRQEDDLRVSKDRRMAVVADGMGGQNGGQAASEKAVTTIDERWEAYSPADEPAAIKGWLTDAMREANDGVCALGKEEDFKGCGTTCTVVVLGPGNTLFGRYLGDSPIFQVRGKAVSVLTKEHSIAQALADAGTISQKEVATHAYKDVLYKYLGGAEGRSGGDEVEVVMQRGDRFLVATDGVDKVLSLQQVRDLLLSSDDPMEIAAALIDAVLAAGAPDNVAVVVIVVS